MYRSSSAIHCPLTDWQSSDYRMFLVSFNLEFWIKIVNFIISVKMTIRVPLITFFAKYVRFWLPLEDLGQCISEVEFNIDQLCLPCHVVYNSIKNIIGLTKMNNSIFIILTKLKNKVYFNFSNIYCKLCIVQCIINPNLSNKIHFVKN